MLLETLSHATDELSSANMTAQSLLTDFGMECENAELDGVQPPAEFTEDERKRLSAAVSSARHALKLLTQLAD